MFCVIRLIPKPDGGARPIGLFTSVLRVFMRALRRTIGQRWIERQIPKSWYGVRGRSSEQAAWTRMAIARYAKAIGQHSIAALFDVEKAYDHPDYHILVCCALRLDFAPWLLW